METENNKTITLLPGKDYLIYHKVRAKQYLAQIDSIQRHPMGSGDYTIWCRGRENNMQELFDLTIFEDEISVIFYEANDLTNIKSLTVKDFKCARANFALAFCDHVWANTGMHWTYCLKCDQDGFYSNGEVKLKPPIKKPLIPA